MDFSIFNEVKGAVTVSVPKSVICLKLYDHITEEYSDDDWTESDIAAYTKAKELVLAISKADDKVLADVWNVLHGVKLAPIWSVDECVSIQGTALRKQGLSGNAVGRIVEVGEMTVQVEIFYSPTNSSVYSFSHDELIETVSEDKLSKYIDSTYNH